MKKIYILLSGTGTVPARVIRFLKGGRYSHTSISLTPATDCLYSYARRTINNPLHAGLVTENIHTNVFAKYPNCLCAVYSLSVSDAAYEIIEAEIKRYFQNYDKAKYSFWGLFALAFGLKIKRRWRLTCSQFVALLLQRTGEIPLPKDPYLMLPTDFPKINDIELIYEGILKNCVITAPSLTSADV